MGTDNEKDDSIDSGLLDILLELLLELYCSFFLVRWWEATIRAAIEREKAPVAPLSHARRLLGCVLAIAVGGSCILLSAALIVGVKTEFPDNFLLLAMGAIGLSSMGVEAVLLGFLLLFRRQRTLISLAIALNPGKCMALCFPVIVLVQSLAMLWV